MDVDTPDTRDAAATASPGPTPATRGLRHRLPQHVQVGTGDGADADDRRLRQLGLPVQRPVPGLRRRQPMMLTPGEPARARWRPPRRRALPSTSPSRSASQTTAPMNVTVQPTGPLPADEHAHVRACNCFACRRQRHGLQGRHAGVTSPASPGRSRSSPRHGERRMMLQGAALQPTLTGRQRPSAVFTPIDADRAPATTPTYDGGTRIGGDTIDRLQPAAARSTRRSRAPDSPAARRSARRARTRRWSSTATRRRTASGTAATRTTSRATSSGRSRSTRSTTIPDGENEDDEWVFPLADPYDYAGNDVIDASGLFAGSLHARPARCRPSASPPTAARATT